MSHPHLSSFADDYSKLVAEARSILSEYHPQVNPEGFDRAGRPEEARILKNHVWTHSESKPKIPLAASALFVYLSPETRQPLTFNCNTRRTNIDTIRKCHGGRITYKQALLDCHKEDSVALGGSGKQVYMLVTSLESQENDYYKRPTGGLIRNEYTHQRSMTYLSFGPNKGPKSLILSNHGNRKPMLEEINRLLFLVGVTPFATPMSRDGEAMSYVNAEHLIERFKDMPLHDPALLKNFIALDLGFDFGTTAQTPIWKQWTMLSFFLQFCSPITFSALEGGHRTWSITSFMTGQPFNQSALNKKYEAFFSSNNPNASINPNCALLAKFESHMVFNEMRTQKEFLDRPDSERAIEASDIIKQDQGTGNDSTRVGFLQLYLIHIANMRLNLGNTDKLFTYLIDIVDNGTEGGKVNLEETLAKSLVNLIQETIKYVKKNDPYKTLLSQHVMPDELKLLNTREGLNQDVKKACLDTFINFLVSHHKPNDILCLSSNSQSLTSHFRISVFATTRRTEQRERKKPSWIPGFALCFPLCIARCLVTQALEFWHNWTMKGCMKTNSSWTISFSQACAFLLTPLDVCSL